MNHRVIAMPAIALPAVATLVVATLILATFALAPARASAATSAVTVGERYVTAAEPAVSSNLHGHSLQ